MRQGQRAVAFVGVNDQETQTTVDGALTCGLLWLEECRLAQRERRVVEGLVLVVPKRAATLTAQRMAHLHPTAAEVAFKTNSISERILWSGWKRATAAI